MSVYFEYLLFYYFHCRFSKDRDLWVVKLTTATELLGVPNIKIVGNIHGNEPVGKEIILHMIQVSHKITTYTRNTSNIILQKTQDTLFKYVPSFTHMFTSLLNVICIYVCIYKHSRRQVQ